MTRASSKPTEPILTVGSEPPVEAFAVVAAVAGEVADVVAADVGALVAADAAALVAADVAALVGAFDGAGVLPPPALHAATATSASAPRVSLRNCRMGNLLNTLIRLVQT